MKKNKTKLPKFIKWFFIPVILLNVWFALSFYYLIQADYSFTVLSYVEKSSIQNAADGRSPNLIRVVGEFTAHENYLGIIEIRFDPTKITPDQTTVFRIKEKGNHMWYYEAQQRTLALQYLPLFPFGFPTIEQSKGKTYQFEVSVIRTIPQYGVAASNTKPNLISKYQFPKSLLLHDKRIMLYFLKQKTLYLLRYTHFPLASLFYLLPLLWYTTVMLLSQKYRPKFLNKVIKKYLKDFDHPLLPIVFSMIIIYTLYIPFRHDFILIPLTGLWVYVLHKYHFDYALSYMAAFLFLCISFIAFVTTLYTISETSSYWVYIFLVVGTIHYFIRNKTRLTR